MASFPKGYSVPRTFNRAGKLVYQNEANHYKTQFAVETLVQSQYNGYILNTDIDYYYDYVH